jgi:hypothetical protein
MISSESGFNESHATPRISVLSSRSVRDQLCVAVFPESVSIHSLGVGTTVGPNGHTSLPGMHNTYCWLVEEYILTDSYFGWIL